jgi:hypothetical protein
MAPVAWGAPYPLELAFPRAAGTAPTPGQPAIAPTHRIFWAYPGIEYNIRAAAIGGVYPYTFSLSHAPEGMTIHPATGEISWPLPPDGISVTPTITVRDSNDSTVSASWTITVDAGRFIFLDAANGKEFDASPPGHGTIKNPFKKIRDLMEGTDYDSKRRNRHTDKIVYFRQGTYFIDGYIERFSSHGGRMAVLETHKPVAWLAYPGETPVIDGQCTAATPQIGGRPCNSSHHIAFYGNSHNTYIDGFRVTNMAYFGFRVEGTGNYQVFRRNYFTRLGPTERSINEGWITTASSGSDRMGSYMTIQDNVFEEVDAGSCIKLYSTQRTLIEDNICRANYDSTGLATSEGIAIKGSPLDRITVRHNVIYDVAQRGIGGNMHGLRSAEILFNRIYNVRSPEGTALEVNQDGMANNIQIYRNTIVGRVAVRNTDAEDGPFTFFDNIIINGDSGNHLHYYEVKDPSRIVFGNNLVGTASDNIVDQNLNLTPAFSSHLGTRGYQVTGSSETLPHLAK